MNDLNIYIFSVLMKKYDEEHLKFNQIFIASTNEFEAIEGLKIKLKNDYECEDYVIIDLVYVYKKYEDKELQ